MSQRPYPDQLYQADLLRVQIDIAIAELRTVAHLITPEQQAKLRMLLDEYAIL